MIIGVQSVQFWIFAKIYGMREGIVPPDPWFSSLIAKVVRIEHGLIAGGVLLLIGLGLGVCAIGSWGAVGFGALNHPEQTMRLVIPSAVAIILAFQIVYGAFFVSILEIRASRRRSGSGAKSRRPRRIRFSDARLPISGPLSPPGAGLQLEGTGPQ